MKKILSPEEKYLRTLTFSALFFLSLYIIFMFFKIIFRDYTTLQIPFINSTLEIIEPQLMIAFFTALYVIFTFLMFVQLKKQNENIREQIKTINQPKIAVRFLPFGVAGTFLELKNIGRGNAYDITLWYKFKKNNKETEEEELAIPFLLPNESYKLILFIDKPYIFFLKEYDEFIFRRRYYSDSGECFKPDALDRHYNLKRILEFGKLDKVPLEYTIEENIKNISDKLKDISTSLKDLKRKFIKK